MVVCLLVIIHFNATMYIKLLISFFYSSLSKGYFLYLCGRDRAGEEVGGVGGDHCSLPQAHQEGSGGGERCGREQGEEEQGGEHGGEGGGEEEVR